MPKQTYLARYLLIIKRLQRGPAAFEQIKHYLQTESEVRGMDYTLEKRTFQRELHEIRDLFGIDIQYSRATGKYAIVDSEGLSSEHSTRLLEAYEMLELVKVAGTHCEDILFERRQPSGLHHFHGLLHAIKNRKVIHINYQKFYEEAPCERTLHPLALKESRGRWYLIAVGPSSMHINPYGLDRIVDLEISKQFFEKPSINVAELFQQSFGIIRGEKPQKVVLSFTPFQGKYVKTFPLHASQKVVQDDSEAYRIELNIAVTHDFVMELLSYGSEVRVITPKALMAKVKEAHQQAILAYS